MKVPSPFSAQPAADVDRAAERPLTRVTIDGAKRTRLSRVRARFTAPADVLLAVRMMGWACVLPALKHLLPLKSLVLLAQRDGDAAARDAGREDQIVTFARWACRITRWSTGGNCLERGLLAYRFLGASNAAPSLVVGIGRGAIGDIRGHAWVVVDGEPVGESPSSIREFSRVVAFHADGTLDTSSRPPASPPSPS